MAADLFCIHKQLEFYNNNNNTKLVTDTTRSIDLLYSMMNVDNGDTHTNGAGANANSEEDDVSVSSRVSNNDATRLSLKEKQEEIAQHESRWVFRLRLLVALVLVVSTVAVVVAVHFYLTDEEEEKFESSFETSAAKVYEAIGKTLDQTLGSTDAFLLQYVVNTHVEEGADAAGEDQTRGWPFATMPGFALQASKLLKLSKSFQLAISHIVEPEQRLDWENYTSQNRQWIDESLDVMEQDPDWHGPVTRNYKLSPQIEGYTNPSVSREMGPLGNNVTTPYMNNYLPQWQCKFF